MIEEAPAKVEQEIEDIRRQFPSEEPQVFQPDAVYQHPFTDKSMVESYIPPNQHYLPHPSFLPPNYHPPEALHKLPSPRIPLPAERFFPEDPTRLQGSPFNRTSEVVREQADFVPTFAPQYREIPQDVARRSGYDSQFAPQVVGRPLQEH